MTDDPDLLTVAGNAATDLMTANGEVADRLLLWKNTGVELCGLKYAAVRDKIADALGFHLAALRRELAEKDRLILAQAERIKAQSELLSKRAETP